MKKRPLIYFGYSITHSPKKFTDSMDKLKDRLRGRYEIIDFIGLVKGTPADVYQYDIRRCVADCDLLVGVCDYPAIGLGYELATAIEKHGKLVLAVAHEKSHVTRLVQGISHPNYIFKRYNKVREIESFIDELLGTLKLDKKTRTG